MAGPKKEFFFTPVGVVEPYCYIAKADFGQGSFESERGKFKVSLTVPAESCQGLMARIVKLYESDYAKRLAEHEKNPPQVVRGKKPLAPYQGELPFFENDDGTVTFKFMAYDRYEKDKEVIMLPLKVVDAKGKRIEKVPNISGGSEGKVRFSMFAYGWSSVAGASVKLQLDSFMLTKLVEFAGGDDAWGGQEEEGYVASSHSDSYEDRSGWNEDTDAEEDASSGADY